MPARFYVDAALHARAEITLPNGAARHVQVLRLQPGAAIVVFDGRGGEWSARVLHIGRTEVRVRVDAFHDATRELPLRVTLAIGMAANERMDALVEKATELGVAAIQPLISERSVLRLSGERATKRREHWQAVAAAACEQSGRTRVPEIAPIRPLLGWLAALGPPGGAGVAPSLVPASALASAPASAWDAVPDAATRGSMQTARVLLSPRAPQWASQVLAGAPADISCLSGPEGGLTDAEAGAAQHCGFVPVSLGPRTLRADTAPLALLAHLALSLESQRESTE